MNLIHQQGQYGCYFLMNHSPINFLIFIYMKYIIFESRLDKIMTNYLDSFLTSKQILDYDDSLVIADPNADDEDNPHWTEYMFYSFDDEDLWVNNQFIEEFSYLFGKEYEESLSFIKDWFKNKFDLK